MDTRTFLNNFGAIADAPGGIDRLRNLVLDMAVRGQLVAQETTNESAGALIERAMAEREETIRSLGIRHPKAPPPMERPTGRRLPLGWEWAQLDWLGLVNPKNSNSQDADTAGFVPMGLVPAELGRRHGHEERPWGEIKKAYTHVANGDVAVAKITPCFENGKSTVFEGLPSGAGAATTELHVLRPMGGLNVGYILIFLKSPQFIENGIPRMTGTAGQKRVPRDYFSGTPVPIPPLAEQHRIVAKVDELMALCDELETRQQTRQQTTTRFRSSALDSLVNAESDDELRTAWQRVQENWAVVADSPEGVAEFWNSLMALAVRGRLGTHRAADEPASAFLERLQEERQRRLDAGELTGRLSHESPVVGPYVLPNGWQWTTFGQACFNRDSERVPVRKSDRKNRQGHHDYYGASGVIDKIDDYLFEGELLLVGEDGANLMLRSTPIAFMAKGQFWVNNHAHVLDSVAADSLRYLAIYINSIDLKPYLTGIAQPKLNQKRLNALLVPMPPFAEQKRIAMAVERFMELCAKVESSVDERQAHGESLALSIVSSLTA